MARKTSKMTALEVSKLAAPGTHRVDDGLYLQIKGGKSWLHRYTFAGKARWAGLGPYPEVSLAEARETRDDQRAQLRKGTDPVAARQAEKAAHAVSVTKAITFKDCAEAYVRAHEAGWRSAVYRSQWSTWLGKYIYPAIGAVPVAAVDTAMTMQLLEPLWLASPITGGRVRGCCEVVLDWAKAREYRSGENPFRWRGHLEMLLPAQSKIHKVKHYEAMPWAAVPMFMVTLRARDGFGARALELLILTCARTGEVLGAKWDEFDLANQVWTIPADRMKNGREHRVPLTNAAMRVVEQMAKVRSSKFVFPGTRGHLCSRAMLHLLDRMGEAKITSHGFRSSFRDWAGECTNFPRELAEKSLAHTVGDETERAYQRGDMLEKRRRLMDAWAEFCTRPIASGENVVSMRASA